MTEMAPEQPVPDVIAELAISYEWEPPILLIKCDGGAGAKIRIELDHSVEDAYEQADILVASVPSMVAAVLKNLESKELASE